MTELLFQFHLTSPQRLWLWGLLILWAALLFGGFVFGSDPEKRYRRMPVWTRMASSATLVAAGWSWWLFVQGTEIGRYALLIAAGMSFGFLGDLAMARLLPIRNRVAGGIASFGVGHLFYIAALVGFGNLAGLDDAAVRWGAVAVWWLIGLVGWWLIVYRGQAITPLHWAALPYALLLASTTGFATGLAVQDPSFIPLALGAALFLLSDQILAGELFSGLHFHHLGDVIWLTYGPGQMLIVYSVGMMLDF
jgi:hypothetical protein